MMIKNCPHCGSDNVDLHHTGTGIRQDEYKCNDCNKGKYFYL